MSARTPSDPPVWRALALIAALILLCHGHLAGRAGYADDYTFLHSVTRLGVWDAIADWQFNSRWTQAVLIPVVLGTVQTEPGSAQWWPVHAIAVLSLMLLALATHQALRMLGLGRPVALTALTLTALHPIRAQVVFWPATIVGYLLPATWTMAAFCLQLRERRQGRLHLARAGLVALAYLAAVLSVEQFLPFCALLLVAASLHHGPRFSSVMESLLIAGLVVAGFVVLTSQGGSSERIAHHGLRGLDELLPAAGEALRISFDGYFLHPLRVLLDPDLASTRAEHVSGARAVVILLCCMGLGWDIAGRLGGREVRTPIVKHFLVATLALLAWAGTLSPLVVVKYYIPERVLFLGLFGVMIVLATCLLAAMSVVPGRVARATLLGSAFVVLAFGTLVHEGQFVEQGRRHDSLTQALHAVDSGSNARLLVAGFPRAVDPVPDIALGDMFEEFAAWSVGHPTPGAAVDSDISAVVAGLCRGPEYSTLPLGETLTVSDDVRLLIWNGRGQLEPIRVLQRAERGTDPATTHADPAIVLIDESEDPDFMLSYGNAAAVLSVNQVHLSRAIDTAIVCLAVRREGNRAARLVARARYLDGSWYLLDRPVTTDDALFTPQSNQLVRALVIPRASELSTLQLELSGLGPPEEGDIERASGVSGWKFTTRQRAASQAGTIP